LESTDIEPYTALLPVLVSSVFNPITSGEVIAIAVIIVLLILSALVSGSEIAFFSLSPSQVHDLKSQETGTDRIILNLLETPKRLLATILISNNFINVAIVVISTYITNSLFNFEEIAYWLAFLIQVVVITAIILFFGEILPKVYATQRNVQFAHLMGPALRFLLKLFYPFSSMLIRSTSIIDNRLTKRSYNISMSELSDAIELTTDHTTPEEEKKILQGIVKFGDIEVKEVMRARLDVAAVELSTKYTELLVFIMDAGYSRIPVYEESFDKIKGLLYIKDLLPYLYEKEAFRWQKLVKEAFYVPENKKISDLLQEFQEKKIHLAIVVDEYGGTSGIITLEDIIEEIVGEISDEQDEPLEDVAYSRIDQNTYLFEGKTSINDFCKVVGVDDDIFDKVKGDADSLAGLILELMEKLPEEEESVGFQYFRFTVKAVDKRRIKRVQVEITEPDLEDMEN
jgi:gliding motility-associated protein GldE